MQIKERINSCRTALEQKRRSVSVFQTKLRHLIESLRSEGMTPGRLSELLGTLETVLQEYSEIGESCQDMVQGLEAIGDHMTQVEDGRHKILNGVEEILKNLSHLDKLAKNGLQVGTSSKKSPKRILLVRITPDDSPPSLKDDDEDEDPAGDTVVH
jgi:CRISPR/Cas system-associated endonuclease Cas3-HD